MKRILYLAAALITVAACGREPAVTEKPSEEPEVGEKLLDVTLIAGNPETRTEVFFDPEVNQFRPFWSAGMETIELGNLNPGNPEFDSDGYYYPDGRLFSATADSRSFSRAFTGSAPAGTYVAYYPAWHDSVYDEDDNVVQDSYGAYIGFDRALTPTVEGWVQTVQHPRRDSFDPKSDFLVSAPIEIAEGQTTVNVAFSRPVAIVRVVLQDKQGTGSAFPLAGQHVRQVILVAPADGEGENETRTPLSGIVDCSFTGDGSDLAIQYWGSEYVIAEYTDETTYIIEEEGAATFFVTLPAILKQTDNPLYIQVVTDDYIIERNIILPADVALQPSRMTTLNIGLFDDGVNGTSYLRYGLSFLATWEDSGDFYEDVPVESLTIEIGKDIYLDIEPVNMDLPGDFEEIALNSSGSEAFRMNLSQVWYDSDQGIRRIILHGIKPGDGVLTVSLPEGYTKSIPVTVVLGAGDRSLEGNFGEDNKPGGGINADNYVEGGTY